MIMYAFATPEQDAIAVVEDGATLMCVPLDAGNRHYRAILESGAEIAPYAPPPKPLPDCVERHQALLVLWSERSIAEADVLAAIEEIEDLDAREVMRIRFYQPLWYRTSEFVAAMQPRFNISDAERDSLFIAADGV